MNKAYFPRLIAGAFIVSISLVSFLNCKGPGKPESLDNHSSADDQTASYVGRENCRECHEKEFNLFQGSDHDMAMDTARVEIAASFIGYLLKCRLMWVRSSTISVNVFPEC